VHAPAFVGWELCHLALLRALGIIRFADTGHSHSTIELDNEYLAISVFLLAAVSQHSFLDSHLPLCFVFCLSYIVPYLSCLLVYPFVPQKKSRLLLAY